MKAILKKNQIVIFAIAVMLIAAGYMNYTTNEKQALQTATLADTEQFAEIGDATLVSANVTKDNSNTGDNSGNEGSDSNNNSNNAKDNNENNNSSKENLEIDKTQDNINNAEKNQSNNSEDTVVNTSAKTSGDQYFVESRLERDKMYSQMIESYQKILSNSQISDAQKEISENEIKNINNTKNAIMIAENLIKNKGFEDLIIFINGESVNVIVKAKELTEEQIAQIQNIVEREIKVEIVNMHVSCKE